MSKIINFTEKETESCVCEVCKLSSEYVAILKECETEEQLVNVVDSLIEDSMRLGVVDYIKDEIMEKHYLLESLTSDGSEEE